jgi:hypothetical protein
MSTPIHRARLTADALNRGFRTVLQAVLVEVGIVVIPELNRLLQDENTVWDVNVARSLIRIGALAAASFIMRRYLDPSVIPTPLPPANSGLPVNPGRHQRPTG